MIVLRVLSVGAIAVSYRDTVPAAKRNCRGAAVSRRVSRPFCSRNGSSRRSGTAQRQPDRARSLCPKLRELIAHLARVHLVVQPEPVVSRRKRHC